MCVNILWISGGMSERQVRKMAKPFCAAKRVPDAHKISTTFFVKKASIRRGLWYFLSAQKVHKKINLANCNKRLRVKNAVE